MIEQGGIYKLKKIKDFIGTNVDDEFKVLKISGDTVYCQNLETKELNMFNIKDFIDPEFPDDIYSDLEIVWEKLNSVMKPMSVNFWKELKEEATCSSLGTAPCPTMGAISGGGISAATVNGLPVPSKSTKGKKKKSKKNEASFDGIIINQEDIDNFDLKETKNYFQNNIQQQEIYNQTLQDKIKIVGKTWTETQSHIGKNPLFLLFKQLDYILSIAKGESKLVQNTKIRKDNIVGWYYLFVTVLFGSCLLKIKLDVAQATDGKKVYFINNKEEVTSGTPSNVKEHCHVGRNITSNNIILEDNENVNTYGLVLNQEYNLTPYFHITLIEKKKKNEEVETSPACFVFTVTPEEMIEQVEETFGVNDTLQTTIKHGREIIRVSVFYTNPEDKALLHTLKLEFLDIDEETVIDEVIEEDLTLSDCRDELVYLFSTHGAIDGELYENINSIVNELLDENFLEEYENITDVIAKELDRLNFEYANTDDIIYKKEGEYKYLIKFDNEVGILKFKVSKDENVVFEKEFQIENEEDVNKAFQEIEDVYRSKGL